MIMCSRHWEAEAVRDGRLTGAEARSFQRHAASCAACSRQAAALDQLGTSLRALPPPPRDALTVRRTRRAILQRLDQEALRPERSRLVRPLVGSAGLAAAVALGLWLRTPAAPLASGLTREPQGDTSAHPHAPPSEALAHDDSPPSSASSVRSLAAVLPSSLPVAPPSSPVGIAPRTTPSPPSPLPPSPASAPLAASPPPAQALAPAAPPGAPAAASAEELQASEFEQAMDHFRAGRLGAASVLFDAFVRSHPGDPRAEDAAYLRVVALARGGQREAARQAASGYLARYPGGLRAKEVQNLVR